MDGGHVWRITTQYLDLSIGDANKTSEILKNTIINSAKQGDIVISCTPETNGRRILELNAIIRRVIVTRELKYYGQYDIKLEDCIKANF